MSRPSFDTDLDQEIAPGLGGPRPVNVHKRHRKRSLGASRTTSNRSKRLLECRRKPNLTASVLRTAAAATNHIISFSDLSVGTRRSLLVQCTG